MKRSFISNNYKAQRCIKIAYYIVENHATVRAAAKEFNISKSVVHSVVTTELQRINLNLAIAVKVVLNENKAERHIRGGEATRKKFLEMKNK